MARRHRAKLVVSLFPFLSILACVIGTLTLMITALALGQMDDNSLNEQLRLDALKRQLEADLKVIEQLKAEIARFENHADDLTKRLVESERQLRELEQRTKELIAQRNKEPEAEIEVIVVDLNAHKERMAKLQEELEEFQKKREVLAAEIKKRNRPPEEAEVIVRPGGSGMDLEPTFVECTTAGVFIHDGKAPVHVRTGDLKTDATFRGLLERIASRPKATVIFLIRDDAIGTYNVARSVALELRARNGKLPIIGHGKLDLSMFR